MTKQTKLEQAYQEWQANEFTSAKKVARDHELSEEEFNRYIGKKSEEKLGGVGYQHRNNVALNAEGH
jgi:hypothetical protein